MRINIKVEDINATNLARIFGVSISFNINCNIMCNFNGLVACKNYLPQLQLLAHFVPLSMLFQMH